MTENSNITENDRTKKIIIIALLALSCLLSAYLLVNIPENKVEYLSSLGQADTLIMRELHDFNIKKSQIHTWSIKVNKKFSRKIYDISLPPGFSKTYLHAEINRRLEPYGIICPAKVYFPEKNMDIEVYYKGTVIRTLRLKTDTTFKMQQSPGTILAYFNQQPSSTLLQKYKSIDQTLPVVFHISKATEGRDWMDALKLKNQPVIFWIQKNFEYHNTSNRSDWVLNRQLKILNQIVHDPTILIAPSLNKHAKNIIEKDGEILGISVVRPGHIILDQEADSPSYFDQEIKKFQQKAKKGKRPVLLIKGSLNNYKLLYNKLPVLKKGGLVLVPPIIDHY